MSFLNKVDERMFHSTRRRSRKMISKELLLPVVTDNWNQNRILLTRAATQKKVSDLTKRLAKYNKVERRSV